MEQQIWLTIGCCLGVGAFVWGFICLRQKRVIENVPTSKVRSMAIGQVEVAGTATPWKLIGAPFSRRDCVYYRTIVERYVEDDDGGSWKQVHQSDSSITPFYIDDGTGQALVSPIHAKVRIGRDFRNTYGEFAGVPGHLCTFLEKRGIKYYDFFGGRRKMRFTEYRIEPGDQVYALGVCQDNRANVLQQRRNRVSDLVQMLKSDPEVMKQYDTDGDGSISPREWDEAMQQLERQADEELAELPKDEVFVGFEKGNPFILSDKSEKAMLRTLAVQSFAGVIGGPALTVGCLIYLIS